VPFDQTLTRISRDECLRLLATATFGRVGVSVDALPAILPVTIVVIDEAVVFRTVPGTKLAAATQRSVLAVEADEYDADAGDGWSVLVRGVASELTRTDAMERVRRQLPESWIGPGAGEHYVRVACDLVTGRRLRRPVRSGEVRVASAESRVSRR
jgi:nitroimidazol reductase NimA-like FMN-containing flavoprotein (pyridoxamine 5'-phosphate oxidase superfamily)